MTHLNIYTINNNCYRQNCNSQNYLTYNTNFSNKKIVFKSNSLMSSNLIKKSTSSNSLLGAFGAMFGITSLFNIFNTQNKQLIKNKPYEIPNEKIELTVIRLGEYNQNKGVDFPLITIQNLLKSLNIGETITIGRDENSDICLPKWSKKHGVSRNHLEITKTEKGISIKDVSSYGSILNSKNKTEHSIKAEDIIITALPIYDEIECEKVSNIMANEVSCRNKELEKYVAEPHKRIKITPTQIDDYIHKIAKSWASFSQDEEKNLKIYTQELNQNRKHIEFILSRPDLFSNPNPPIKSFATWNEHKGNDQKKHISWKMHVFSNKSEDWQNLAEIIIPYLKDKGINFKTFNIGCTPESLKDKQNGKAFTIYPTSKEEMAQVARDLDYIIRKNKLETSESNITGDAKLGNSGRLFYRYEYRSKVFKDEVVNVIDNYNYYRYQLYEKNRGNRPNAHLAQDMTPEDDIWKDFDPSRPF